MISRSARGNCHAVVPARCTQRCCSATVMADMANANPKNGATRKKSLRRQHPRSHHVHNNNTSGNTTVEGLLSMAAEPKATASMYQFRLLSVSNLRKHSTDKKKKN